MRLAILFAAVASIVSAADLRWITLPDASFEVNGLPAYKENNGALIRLPLTLQKVVRPEVWSLAQSPSGGRIRFRTDSARLAIRLEYPSAPNMANMHAFGQTGVDAYVDGVYMSTAVADKDSGKGKVVEKEYFNFSGRPPTSREITLYLPLYKGVKVLGIGVEDNAKITAARKFALPAPAVFYGTSITQGGCASRSGLSYQAILGRLLNIDFVNLGFSGNGMGEPEMAAAVADIPASCYVLDFAQNNRTLESVSKVYGPFLDIVRAKHPDTPIVAITPIYAAREAYADPSTSAIEKMRGHIRLVVSQRIASGDRHLQLIEGTDLLGPSQGDGLVDGTHPNDLGFQWMADGLAARFRKLLNLR